MLDIVGGVTDISQTQVNADNNKNNVVFTVIDMRCVVSFYMVTIKLFSLIDFWLYIYFIMWLLMSLSATNIWFNVLFGVSLLYNFTIIISHKEDGNVIVLLQNGRIKGAQGIIVWYLYYLL